MIEYCRQRKSSGKHIRHWGAGNFHREVLRAFRETHQTLGCWECCCVIQPGDDIWVKDDHVYCSAECLASSCDGYQLTFQMDNVDDDGYIDMFPTWVQRHVPYS